MMMIYITKKLCSTSQLIEHMVDIIDRIMEMLNGLRKDIKLEKRLESKKFREARSKGS